MTDDLVKTIRWYTTHNERIMPQHAKAAADRIEKLEEQAHYANGVADLAMKHRDYAEQRVEKLEAALKKIAYDVGGEYGRKEMMSIAQSAIGGKDG